MKASERAPWLRVVKEPGYPAPARCVLRKPDDVARLIHPRTSKELVECFYLIALNVQNETIAVSEVCRGTLDTSLVHPREVFRLAILLGAQGIVVAHNHPSGNPAPSIDDKAITRQLRTAGELLDIPLADHVIIGEGGRVFSFAEAGILV